MCQIKNAACPECTWTTHLFSPCHILVKTYLDPLVLKGYLPLIRTGEANLEPARLWDGPSGLPACKKLIYNASVVQMRRCPLHVAEDKYATRKLEVEDRERKANARRLIRLDEEKSGKKIRKALRIDLWTVMQARKEAEKGDTNGSKLRLMTSQVPLGSTCMHCNSDSIGANNKNYHYKLGEEVTKALMMQYESPHVSSRTGQPKRPLDAKGVICAWIHVNEVCGNCLLGVGETDSLESEQSPTEAGSTAVQSPTNKDEDAQQEKFMIDELDDSDDDSQQGEFMIDELDDSDEDTPQSKFMIDELNDSDEDSQQGEFMIDELNDSDEDTPQSKFMIDELDDSDEDTLMHDADLHSPLATKSKFNMSKSNEDTGVSPLDENTEMSLTEDGTLGD